MPSAPLNLNASLMWVGLVIAAIPEYHWLDSIQCHKELAG